MGPYENAMFFLLRVRTVNYYYCGTFPVENDLIYKGMEVVFVTNNIKKKLFLVNSEFQVIHFNDSLILYSLVKKARME